MDLAVCRVATGHPSAIVGPFAFWSIPYLQSVQ